MILCGCFSQNNKDTSASKEEMKIVVENNNKRSIDDEMAPFSKVTFDAEGKAMIHLGDKDEYTLYNKTGKH